MNITEKISHAAERKAFETVLDSMLKKGQTQDVGDLAQQLIDIIQKIHKGTWSDDSFDALRAIAENPEGKWAHYAQRLIRENDPLHPQDLPDQCRLRGWLPRLSDGPGQRRQV